MADKTWLQALKDALTTIDTVVDALQTDLSNGTDGLGALKALIDNIDGDLITHATALGTHDTDIKNLLTTIAAYIDTEVAGIQTDLDNATDGLGALKALIDNLDADLVAHEASQVTHRAVLVDIHDTDIPAIKTVVDTITPAGPSNTQLNTAIALIAQISDGWDAGLATILDNFSAGRIGYLDQLDFALQEAIAAIKVLADSLDLTVFSQEAVGAMDSNGVNWVDLLDKSTITKPTKIHGFKVTKAGAWAGDPKIRITDGAGNKIFPFQAEYVEGTDFTSGEQAVLSFPISIPVADGYKFQFRSSDGGDGAGETLQLNNLDIVEAG